MSPSRGSFSPSPDDWSTLLAITAFCAIALYNFVELNTIIFTTFKRRSGLYFWSFLVSSNGVAPYAIGFLLKDLSLSPSVYLDITLIIVGWVCMVTGQAFVLYSRLHLVMRDREKLRLILTMIITNAIICHVPTTILVYGANSSDPQRWLQPYNIYEKIEVTLFFIQEVLISGIYIYQTISFFRLEAALHEKATLNLMMHLIWINVIIILLDMSILGLEYASFYNMQTAVKGMVYSIKLKLEFKVLNGLIELTKAGATSRISARSPCNKPCSCTGGPSFSGGGGGIYDGTDPRSATMDFETFNETMNSRACEGAKSDRAESAYEVRIFSEGEQAGDSKLNGDGITVRTETQVSTMKLEEWETMVWPGLETLEVEAAGSRSGTHESRPNSCSQSSEIEFATIQHQ